MGSDLAQLSQGLHTFERHPRRMQFQRLEFALTKQGPYVQDERGDAGPRLWLPAYRARSFGQGLVLAPRSAGSRECCISESLLGAQLCARCALGFLTP